MFARVRSHLGTVAVAGVVAALVAGGSAVAGPLVEFAKHSGNADRVDGLNASRMPRAGQLLALDAKRKFPASVVPAGAAGSAGAAGPAGATGPAGPNGPAGPAGGPGAKGDTGAAGANGADGVPGAKGDTGAAGANGADGAAGAKGDKGDTGNKGDTGAAGTNGTNGLNGADGAAGAKGEKGDKGDKGDAGADGANGSDGAPGAKGDKGDKGDPGAAGTNGTNGVNGADGAPGAKGDKGEKGDKGDTGEAGSAAAYPPIVDVNPILRPSRSHLWDRVQTNGSSWFNGYRSSFPNGTSASYLEWDLPLQAGTWTIDVIYVKSHDAAILSLSLDGDDVGPEVDAYQPAADGFAFNEVATFSSVTVATTGIHSLRIRTASKNPASSDYLGYLTWIRLVRA